MPATRTSALRSNRRSTGPFERAIVATVFAVVGWFASTSDFATHGPTAHTGETATLLLPHLPLDRENLSQQILPIELISLPIASSATDEMAADAMDLRLHSDIQFPTQSITNGNSTVLSEPECGIQDRRAWNVWQRQDALLAVRPTDERDRPTRRR